MIDWGTWFGFIAKPLFLVLTWTAKHVTGDNFGWAIVLVTIAINMVLFPLRFSSMKSSKKMQALQPQIAGDQRQVQRPADARSPQAGTAGGDDGAVQEARRQSGGRMRADADPAPVSVSRFYTVLSVTIEMRGASWLWVHDLSQPETLAIRVLPVLLMVTQFLQQKMTPSPGMDPAQQKMMLFMPLVLGYMFYYQSAGLVLYWLTGSLVGIAQQWLLNRGTPAPAVAVPSPPQKRRNR